MPEYCENCDASLSESIFKNNNRLLIEEIALINQGHGLDLSTGCQKCAGNLKDTAAYKVQIQVNAVRGQLEMDLHLLPLASLPSPSGWNYTTIGLVTAQTVSGTGLFSDVTSAFTDLFGAQSGAYNQKIRDAENICRASLRAQAYHLGGNAVIGVDVDYAEVGGQRAMLMVCMTGTAVNVTNGDVLQEGMPDALHRLAENSKKLAYLQSVLPKGS